MDFPSELPFGSMSQRTKGLVLNKVGSTFKIGHLYCQFTLSLEKNTQEGEKM